MSRVHILRILSVLVAVALLVAGCADDGEVAGDAGEESGQESDDASDEESAETEELVEIEIGGFEPPSLGAFLPAVIEDQNFDEDFGFDLTFATRPPPQYNTEFAAGQWPLGSSSALLSEAVRYNEGVDVVYLFNVYDFFGAVLSTTDEIQELGDLGEEGVSLAASTVTTNYAMFQWFAMQQGVDLEGLQIQDTGTGGLLTQAVTGRSDAVQLWEPAYTLAVRQEPDLTDIDLHFEAWEEEFGLADIPYIGVTAHREWVEENEEHVEPLYELMAHTADWVEDNPAEASEIIAETVPEGDPEAIQDLIESPERMAFNVVPAAEVADGIRAVWEAGLEVGWIEEAPGDDFIWGLED